MSHTHTHTLTLTLHISLIFCEAIQISVPSFFCRSPSTPDLSTEELPDDITSEITDIPHDLELNQEDFSDVLPRLPDDLQDFDFFEGSYAI